MQTTIPEKNLRQSIAGIFNDAITYFKLRAEDAAGSQDKLSATMAAKDFATGRDMLDLLIDRDGETFFIPEAADIVTQGLLNFHVELDREKFPLLSWHVMDVLIRSQKAPCIGEREVEIYPSQSLH